MDGEEVMVVAGSLKPAYPGLPLPGWAEIRQRAYKTQRPSYKDGDTSPSPVLTGILSLIDRSYRDREIGVFPVGPTLAAAWG